MRLRGVDLGSRMTFRPEPVEGSRPGRDRRAGRSLRRQPSPGVCRLRSFGGLRKRPPRGPRSPGEPRRERIGGSSVNLFSGLIGLDCADCFLRPRPPVQTGPDPLGTRSGRSRTLPGHGPDGAGPSGEEIPDRSGGGIGEPFVRFFAAQPGSSPRARRLSSSRTGTPSRSALSRFEPGSSPATR